MYVYVSKLQHFTGDVLHGDCGRMNQAVAYKGYTMNRIVLKASCFQVKIRQHATIILNLCMQLVIIVQGFCHIFLISK